METRPNRTPKLSIILLAYNEEADIEEAIKDCVGFLEKLGEGHEVIVVDDGSADRTAEIARSMADRFPIVQLVSHPENLGMGAGITTGIANSTGEYFTFLAADRQIRAQELAKMLPYLEQADIVLTFYTNRPSSFYRTVISRCFRLTMRLLLGVTFRLEGIYLFPRRVAVEEIGLDTLGSKTFFLSFELISLALKRGYKAVTIPIEVHPREHGGTKVANLRKISSIIGEVLAFRRRQS